MQVEVSEDWVTVGAIIGTMAFGAVGAFVRQYVKSRQDERTSAAASPAIVASAVGAAFIDKSTAQDVAVIRHDVNALRKLAEDRKEHDDEDRVKRVARETALETVRQQEAVRAPSKRRGAADE